MKQYKTTTDVEGKRVQITKVFENIDSLHCNHDIKEDSIDVNLEAGERFLFKICLCKTCFDALKAGVNSIGT